MLTLPDRSDRAVFRFIIPKNRTDHLLVRPVLLSLVEWLPAPEDVFYLCDFNFRNHIIRFNPYNAIFDFMDCAFYEIAFYDELKRLICLLPERFAQIAYFAHDGGVDNMAFSLNG